MSKFEFRDLDAAIWQSELEDFVPAKVLDAHTHVYRGEHNLDSDRKACKRWSEDYPVSDVEFMDECYAQLMPDREVHYLMLAHPFVKTDFEGLNEFTAAQIPKDPLSGALMVVAPHMTPERLREDVLRHGFLGFKPYRFFAATGDSVECRVTDMLPESQIEIADELGLIVTLHLAKRRAIADAENIEDVCRLSKGYPNVTWILAHCARSFAVWPLEAAWESLANLPNVFFDTSAVCESDVFALLLSKIAASRILYGSDNLPAGLDRGKYITFGHAWTLVSEDTKGLNLTHCDPRATFVCYESLRALRRGAEAANLAEGDLQDIFYDNAARLIAEAQERVNGAK